MAPRQHHAAAATPAPTPGPAYARGGSASTQAASPPPRPPPPPKRHEERKTKRRRTHRRWTDVLEQHGTGLIHLAADSTPPPPSACATMVTPALARNGLNIGQKPLTDKSYHATLAAYTVIQDMEAEEPKSSLAEDNALLRDLLIAEKFVVNVGKQLLDASRAPHFTFIDPRRAYWQQIVKQALRMSAAFGRENKQRVIFSIPATQDGILAARILARRHGIRTNMLYVTCLQQAQWCIEAGASAVTFSCLPMLALAEDRHPHLFERVLPEDHPCIQQIQATVAYVHQNKCDTQVIVADAVGITNLEALLGIDYLVVGAGSDVLDWPSNDAAGFVPFTFRRASATARHIRDALAAPYPPTESLTAHTDFEEIMQPIEYDSMKAVVGHGVDYLRRDMEKLDRALEPFTKARLKVQCFGLVFPKAPPPIPIGDGNVPETAIKPRGMAQYVPML